MPADRLLTRRQALALLAELLDEQVAAGLLDNDAVTKVRMPHGLRQSMFLASQIDEICTAIRAVIAEGEQNEAGPTE